MFDNMKLARQEKSRKKELKEQFVNMLNNYPLGPRGRDLSVGEKRAKMVLIARVIGACQSMSFEYAGTTMYNIMEYDTNIIPSFEDACKTLGASASSFNNLGAIYNLVQNNKIAQDLPNLLIEYNSVDW